MKLFRLKPGDPRWNMNPCEKTENTGKVNYVMIQKSISAYFLLYSN